MIIRARTSGGGNHEPRAGEQQRSGRHEGCKREGGVSRQIFIGSETTYASGISDRGYAVIGAICLTALAILVFGSNPFVEGARTLPASEAATGFNEDRGSKGFRS